MVFLSSQIKLENLPDTKEEICKYDWFLFSIMIKTKNIKYDDELYRMYNRMIWYPFIHKKPLFIYLMTDNHYFKSSLYGILGNTSEIVCMGNISSFTPCNKKNIFIPEEKRIFKEKDIMDMFEIFKKNNFKGNPVCGYVLP